MMFAPPRRQYDALTARTVESRRAWIPASVYFQRPRYGTDAL